jgi:hypothetical protein
VLFRKRLNNVLAALVFAAILGYSAYYRFDGITERGMIHSDVDAWKYLDTAANWSKGNYTWMSGQYTEPDRFYRPGAHLLHMIAIRVWGYNDYAIKVLNAIMDIVIIILVFVIAGYLSGSAWVGLAAAAVYGLCSPMLIFYVWGEIPHAPSSMFVSLSLLAFLAAMGKSRGRRAGLALFLLCGIALGCSANIHPDLALLGPGYVVVLLGLALARRGKYDFVKAFVRSAGFLTAGLFIPYLAGMLFFGPREVVRVFSNELLRSKDAYTQGENIPNFLVIAWKVFHTSIQGLFEGSMTFLWAFLGALVIAVVLPLLRRARRPALYVAPGLLLTYALLYGLLIGDFPDRMFRLFIPLLPLLVVATATWYYEGLRQIAGRYAILLFLPLALITARSGPVVSEATAATWRVPAAKGLRITYDKLKMWVNENNRLLVLPLGAPHAQFAKEGRWGLSHDIYFGPNAFFLTQVDPFPFPYTADALRRICREHKVKYVLLFENRLSEELTLRRQPQFNTIADGKPYSRELEFAIIGDFLKSVRARGIGNWERGLYQIPDMPAH